MIKIWTHHAVFCTSHVILASFISPKLWIGLFSVLFRMLFRERMARAHQATSVSKPATMIQSKKNWSAQAEWALSKVWNRKIKDKGWRWVLSLRWTLCIIKSGLKWPLLLINQIIAPDWGGRREKKESSRRKTGVTWAQMPPP